MKPAWFYDIIGAVSSHDVKLALEAWDAELLDHVKVDLDITTPHTDIYDPLDYGRIATAPGHTSAVATITDIQIGDVPARFNPIKMLLQPETINCYLQDMDPEKGQYRPYLLFQCMFIDYGHEAFSFHSMSVEREWEHAERWQTDDRWYFIQPFSMTMNHSKPRESVYLW